MLAASPAHAERTALSISSEAAAGSELAPIDASPGEIIVSAQRREVREKDIPAAISVYSATDLATSNTRSFEDLARRDSSVQLSAYQGEMQMFVRGLGAETFVGGYDSSVAVFSDGIYLSRSSAVGPSFFDLDHVEVLKGPQGSLYGRNATGGAILLVPREPTSNWTNEASLEVGNYSTVNATAAVGGPLGDELTFRAAVGTGNHSGYTTLDFGSDVPDSRRWRHAEDRHDLNARLKLNWKVAPAINFELTGDYYRADDRAVVTQFAGPGYANSPLFLARLAEGEQGEYRSRTIKTSLIPYDHPENWGVSGKLIANLGPAVLTSISAFRQTRPENFNDLSNSTILGESQFKQENARQFTQDLILTSQPGTRLGYLLGTSYFHENDVVRNEYFFPYALMLLGVPDGGLDCCLLKVNGTVRTNAYAAFGEVNFALTPLLTLTAGGRYTSERRSGLNLLEFVGFVTQNNSPFVPRTFHAFTPRFSADYRLSQAITAYASVSRGFKSGGFNIGSMQNTAFEPEKVWSYEAGVKSDLFGGALNFKVSAFHYDYTDLQVQGVNQNSLFIRNAASAKIDGLELQARTKHIAGFALDGSATLLHARFTRYMAENTKTPELGILNLDGNPLPQAPRFKAQVGLEYVAQTHLLGRVTLRTDAMWQDRVYFSEFKDPQSSQAGYLWLKARITIAPTNKPYQIALFADNLTNKTVFTNVSITGDLDGSRANGNLAPPRTFGVALTFRK